MNLRRLRHFLSVASEGSLSQTARVHGIAQPALTRQIQLLESELGVSLFERRPRGLRLTSAGQYFRDALEVPLAEIETAMRGVSAFPKHVKASLTIGLPPVVSGLIGAQIIRRIRDEHPNIALRIIEEDSSRLAIGLARRTIDAAILVSVVPEQRVSQSIVLQEPLLLVGHPDAPILQQPAITFTALEQVPLILPSARSGSRINFDHRAEAGGVKVSPVMAVDSLELTKTMVRGGDAFTILPAPAFRDEAARGDLVGISIADPDLTQPVLWAVKPDWRLPRTVYNELERIVFEEWHACVRDGLWPGEWVFDFNLLSIPFHGETTPTNAGAISL